MRKSILTVEALRNIKQVGSIVSSSRFLTKKILSDIDFSQDLKVLELGAGDGVITKVLLEQLSSASTLISYENLDSLVQSLNAIADHRLVVKGECVSALNQLEENKFDVVISSLPLANFKGPFKKKIYKDVQSKLSPGGVFIQYQYSLLDYRDIEKNFDQCSIDFCLLNVPPAFIYRAKKDRIKPALSISSAKDQKISQVLSA